jgi:hypothetical protein
MIGIRLSPPSATECDPHPAFRPLRILLEWARAAFPSKVSTLEAEKWVGEKQEGEKWIQPSLNV